MQRKYNLMPRTPNSIPLTLPEQEKVKTLSASGKTPHSIAKELNRSPHTIRRYLSCPEASKQIQEIKEELPSMFEGLAKRMITSITDEDIQKINAYQRTVSAAVGTDKMRLLRDQSTENVDIRALHLSLEELERQEQELLKFIGKKEEVAEVDTQDIVSEEKVKENE